MEQQSCTAFAGMRRIAQGSLAEVTQAAKAALAADRWAQVLIFDDETGAQVDLDYRDAPPEAPARKAGRPKLGVVAREVTLLPRHWEWLAGQPGGASVALRKLVEQASRANREEDRRRRARDAAYRFLSSMGGNLPDFEEASRALFAGQAAAFESKTEAWPSDVRAHARMLAARAFSRGEGEES